VDSLTPTKTNARKSRTTIPCTSVSHGAQTPSPSCDCASASFRGLSARQPAHPPPMPRTMSRHQFLSVNMCCMNTAMHSLLEMNMADDVLFVQEPWFDWIGVKQADKAREGVDVQGGVNHPDWELYYPYFTNNKRAKVMTYRCKQVANRVNPLTIVPRLDLAKHPTLLITDIYVHKDLLCIINYYNDVDHSSSLSTLLSLDLDPTVPTLLLGDFNLHSCS
jgi:hypothetical protein